MDEKAVAFVNVVKMFLMIAYYASDVLIGYCLLAFLYYIFNTSATFQQLTNIEAYKQCDES